MYVKMFQSIYDGSLATRGPWQALVTFQQLLVLCDKDGVVDMTPEVISRRTTIPLDIVTHGLAVLEQPDPESRRADEEGRRIVKIADNRAWGWQIVNYAHYRAIRTADERREYMKTYMRDRRAAEKTTSPGAKRLNGHKIAFDFENGIFTGIDENQLLAWQEAYPALIIDPEVARAAAWVKANPANRKQNYARFLVNWFSKAQERAPRVT